MANKIYINAVKMFNEASGESAYTIKDLSTSEIIIKLLSYMKGSFNAVEFTIKDSIFVIKPHMFDCTMKTIYTFALENVESTLHRDSIKAMLERLSDTFNVNSLEINLDNVYLEHADTSGFKNRVYLHISLSMPNEEEESQEE